MKSSFFLLSLLLALVFAGSSSAQVPSTLNYQGRVAVSGVNFTGTGLFKFALVNGAGNQTFWSNDGTSNAGSQPSAAVSIPVASGLYSVQLGDTALANMTAVPVTAFSTADVRLRVWFSDGANGFQLMTPDQKIAAVGYAMVAATVPDGSITAAKLAPGVGGGGGSIPDGSITAAKLASGAAAANLAAGGLSAVASGGVIGSTDPNNAALINQGFVRDAPAGEFGETWTPMPSGDAVAAHTTVWTGTELIIWGGVVPSSNNGGPTPEAYSAINRGMRYNPTTGVWTPVSTVGAPQARHGHSAIWTGTEMIIWGGQTKEGTEPPLVLATGGRYNPATNTWSSMMANVDSTGAPPGMPGIPDTRQGHLAFWTGMEMLVWGGSSTPAPLGMPAGGVMPLPGRRYNPTTNTWSSMAATLPEMGMAMSYSGVWTGSEMIIWGFQTQGGSEAPAAGRYSPAANVWAPLPRIPGDPVVPASGATVIWAGSQMIVWGGMDPGSMTYLNTGYRFNPSTSSWSTMSTTGAPAARGQSYAAWNDTEMVVWGGKGSSGGPPPATSLSYNDGGRYNPSTDTWQSISATDAPPFRNHGSATLGAGKLMVWAGLQTGDMMGMGYKFMKHGGVYDLATSTWSPLNNGSPAPRFGHTSVWTGTEMIVWGGAASTMAVPGLDATFNDGARFNPSTGVWTPLPAANAPSGRYGHTAVWTGTEMIVWGGQRYDTGTPMVVTLNTGARFNPLTNTWTALPTLFGPSARSRHVALWTGSPMNQMIIWGGLSDGMSMATNTGARYDVGSDTWVNLSTTSAPMEAADYVGLWTGSEMLLFSTNSPGGRYNPTSNSWSTMAVQPPTFAVGGAATLYAVWAGGEALVLMADEGGEDHGFASYSPVADYWQVLATAGIPGDDGLSKVQTLWTGSEMIIVGETGTMPDTYPAGGRYMPAAGAWTDLERTGAPDQLMGTAVWTGTEMLMWGGTGSTGPFPTGSVVSDRGTRYRLPQMFYLYRKP
ncbi:MAG: Kelch repeat-containing protein [Prosthecobacter sp.]